MNGQWIGCKLTAYKEEGVECLSSVLEVPIFFSPSVIKDMKVDDMFAWRIREDVEYNENNIEIGDVEDVDLEKIREIVSIRDEMLKVFQSLLYRFDTKEITSEECVKQYNEAAFKHFQQIETILGKNTFRKMFRATAEEAGHLLDLNMFRRAHEND